MVKENNLIPKIEIKDEISNNEINTIAMKDSKEMIGIQTIAEDIMIKIEGTKPMETK
jgi:hypothetical protein